MPLSEKLLSSWVRCRRKAWLDSFGNKKKRTWTAHTSLQLNHEKKSYSELTKGRSHRGLISCAIGANWVIGAKLEVSDEQERVLIAYPPLLEKVDGKSIWGSYAYRPVIARQGKNINRIHRIKCGFYSYLLQKIQKGKVNNCLVVRKTDAILEEENIIFNEKTEELFFQSLIKLEKDLKRNSPPPITSDRKKCALCSWKEFCNSEAEKEGHLSEISGIGSKRKLILQEIGITNIKDLANFKPDDLENKLIKFGKQHEGIAYKIVEQAKSQKNKYSKKICNEPILPELQKAPGILIYDIESDPDLNNDFLHGFLAIRKKYNGNWDIKNAKYQPLLNITRNENKNNWHRIKSILNKYKGWSIIHFGETESSAIRKLALNAGQSKQEANKSIENFIDLHQRIRNYWVLPVNSYGLKSIAKWIGFNWTQKNVDGSTAILWWRLWIDCNKKSKLNNLLIESIFTYNKDDCIATLQVVKWLLLQEEISYNKFD
tara:strand:+ start:1328 stop:2788 length:1461 start_codon:yes stop_codon:yes gene_type:complete